MKKINEIIKEKVDIVKNELTEWVDSNSDSIVDMALGGACLFIASGVITSWCTKLIPSRTNLHVYIHMK